MAAGNGEDCGHLLCVAVDAERARARALDETTGHDEFDAQEHSYFSSCPQAWDGMGWDGMDGMGWDGMWSGGGQWTSKPFGAGGERYL